MMLIDCPHCGERAQAEFVYERTLDSVVTLEMEASEVVRRLYERANPRGLDDELWRHTYGCRQWIILTRDRATHDIDAVSLYRPERLP